MSGSYYSKVQYTFSADVLLIDTTVFEWTLYRKVSTPLAAFDLTFSLLGNHSISVMILNIPILYYELFIVYLASRLTLCRPHSTQIAGNW
jgi:hypothetical protein